MVCLGVGISCFSDVAFRRGKVIASRGRGDFNKHIFELRHEYHKTWPWWKILEMSLHLPQLFFCLASCSYFCLSLFYESLIILCYLLWQYFLLYFFCVSCVCVCVCKCLCVHMCVSVCMIRAEFNLFM